MIGSAVISRVMRVTLFSALLSVVATSASAQGLEGTWEGWWIKENDPLPVTVNFQKSSTGYSGSFDSDLLQVAGIPFGRVDGTNGNVHFLLKGDESTSVFDGRILDNAMLGTFTDGYAGGTFKLTRTALSPARILTREVLFPDGT